MANKALLVILDGWGVGNHGKGDVIFNTPTPYWDHLVSVYPNSQLQASGENVFRGYWKRPEADAEAFTADGFVRTGDLGRLDERGYLWLAGRARELIITGGLNVYPKEVELAIDRIEGVAESAVFGLPDPDFGEAVTAAVVRGADARTLCAEKILARLKGELANYKLPKRIVFVDELPRNAMGKVQKHLLAQRCTAAGSAAY